MSNYDHGPIRTYEVTWQSGHVETVDAHQVMYSSWGSGFSSLFSDTKTAERAPRVTFHADLDGRWALVLSALEADIRTVRDVTTAEVLDGGESS